MLKKKHLNQVIFFLQIHIKPFPNQTLGELQGLSGNIILEEKHQEKRKQESLTVFEHFRRKYNSTGVSTIGKISIRILTAF